MEKWEKEKLNESKKYSLKRVRRERESKKRSCQLLLHANVMGFSDQTKYYDHTLVLKVIIVIDCIIWTHDILINGFAVGKCDFRSAIAHFGNV